MQQPVSSVPDFYSDFVQISLSDWGVVLGFRTTMPPLEPPTEEVDPGQVPVVRVEIPLKAIVRLAHGHAKALAIILKRNLVAYEKRADMEIQIPQAVRERLNILPDEWP